jgi:tetratricopeptide (TPR) repeat protein
MESMLANNNKLIRGSVVFMLTAILLLFQSCSKSHQAYLDAGKKHLEEGRYNEALIEFRNAARKNARNPEAYYQMSLAYMHIGAYPEALRELETAVTAAPDHMDAQLRIGNLLMMQFRYGEAREKAEMILGKTPGNTEAQILLANSWAGMIHVNDSIQEIRKGLEQEPQLMPPFFKLGPGDDDNRLDAGKAEELYREIVDSGSRPVEARLALGNFYFLQGRNSEAEEQYKAAAQYDPQSRDAVSALGFFYLQTRRPAEAEELYKKYLELSKDDPDSQVILPDFYLASGEIDKSIQTLEKMVADNHENVVFKRRLASVLFDQRAFDKAGELADELLEKDAGDAVANSIKGRILLNQNKGAEAVSHLQQVTRRRPRSTQAHYFLGRAYLQNGEPSKAASEFEIVVALDPAHYRALLSLANLKFESGNANEAIQLAQRVLSRNPNVDEARLILGSALAAQKDYSAAVPELQAFIKANPDSPAGNIQLGKLYFAQGDQTAADAHLKAALKSDPDVVLRLIDEAIKANPKETEIRLMKANLLMSQDKIAESIREIQAAIQNDHNSKQARYMLGMAYIRDKNEAQAETALNAAIRLDPGYIQAYQSLAQMKLSSGDVNTAIQYGRDALKADPNAVEMRLLLGEGLSGRKYYKEAIAELEAYTVARPADPRGLHSLGTAYLESGNTERAESLFQSALERNPDGVAPLASLVRMDIDRKQPSRAIARINAQIQKAPQAAGLYELLGQVHANQGNTARAEEAFRRQASLDGGRVAGSLNLARLHLSQKSFEAAIAELQNAVSADPNSGELYTLLGTIYENLKDSKMAMENYRMALKNDSSQSIAANNLAFLLGETGGDLKEAEQFAQQARKLLPNSAAVADTLAWIYYKRGAYSSAIDLLRDCVKQEPENAVYFYHLGMAYSKNGNPAQAKEALTQALNLNPNIPQAMEIKDVIDSLPLI